MIAPRTHRTVVLASAIVCAGCATAPRVSPPAEIPALEAAYRADPGDDALARRLAASLAAADRCDDARAVAADTQPLADRAWPTLIEGRCLEAEGELDAALDTYRAFLGDFPDGEGAVPVRGRLLLAQEEWAVARANGVDPASLSPPPDDAVAVLPLTVVGAGADRYGPLGRGLGAQISSDLLLLDRFRLVERMELQAVLDELARSGSAYADSTTSPSLGRIVQASRLVSGSVAPDEATVGLRAQVVAQSGEVMPTDPRVGALDQLLVLEKEVVFDIAALLGYQVSPAERTRILENGTQNLQAFLLYSEGLELADRGDYGAAAARFSEAQRLDPDFTDARRMLEASVGAEVMGSGGDDALVQSSGDIAGAVGDVMAGGGSPDPIDGLITSTVNDVAPTQGELAVGPTTDAPGSGTTGAVGTILNPPALPPLTTLRPVRIPVRIRIPGGGAP